MTLQGVDVCCCCSFEQLRYFSSHLDGVLFFVFLVMGFNKFGSVNSTYSAYRITENGHRKKMRVGCGRGGFVCMSLHGHGSYTVQLICFPLNVFFNCPMVLHYKKGLYICHMCSFFSLSSSVFFVFLLLA